MPDTSWLTLGSLSIDSTSVPLGGRLWLIWQRSASFVKVNHCGSSARFTCHLICVLSTSAVFALHSKSASWPSCTDRDFGWEMMIGRGFLSHFSWAGLISAKRFSDSWKGCRQRDSCCWLRWMKLVNQTKLQSQRNELESMLTVVDSIKACGSTSATGLPFRFKNDSFVRLEKTERDTRPILLLLKSLLRLAFLFDFD